MFVEFNKNTDMGILTPGRRIKLYRGEEVILLKIVHHQIKVYNIKQDAVIDTFIGCISETCGRRPKNVKTRNNSKMVE